jgi:hypothetical protein
MTPSALPNRKGFHFPRHPRLVSTVLGIASELLVGALPLSILIRYRVSAEAGFPLAITQFPAIIAAFVLMAFENPKN